MELRSKARAKVTLMSLSQERVEMPLEGMSWTQGEKVDITDTGHLGWPIFRNSK